LIGASFLLIEMSHIDSELSSWHDWTNPDFFQTEQHRESNVVTLFLRQMLPKKLFRTKMTLTGWCLVVVSLGLGLAAYNTANNILFLALSLILSSMILSGILSLLNFRKLDWDLKAPSHLSVGESGTIQIHLTNGKALFPSMAVYFQLESEVVGKAFDVYMQTTLNPHESSSLKSTVTPKRRGYFEIRIVNIGSRFPFGFLQRTIRSNLKSSLIVWPERIAYIFQGLSEGQRIMNGSSKKRPGQGSDLLNIRPYVQGDAPRFIHWKATAKMGKLTIRQLAREGESGYHLYIDSSLSEWSEASFEQLCSLVRSLAEDLFNYGRLESVQFDSDPPMTIRSMSDLHTLLDALARLEPHQRSTDSPVRRLVNQLTFSPSDADVVAIYLDGNYAGQTEH